MKTHESQNFIFSTFEEYKGYFLKCQHQEHALLRRDIFTVFQSYFEDHLFDFFLLVKHNDQGLGKHCVLQVRKTFPHYAIFDVWNTKGEIMYTTSLTYAALFSYSKGTEQQEYILERIGKEFKTT